MREAEDILYMYFGLSTYNCLKLYGDRHDLPFKSKGVNKYIPQLVEFVENICRATIKLDLQVYEDTIDVFLKWIKEDKPRFTSLNFGIINALAQDWLKTL